MLKRKNDTINSSLDNEVEVLNGDSDDSELEFKLDLEIFEVHNWLDIKTEVYKGDITPNIKLLGNSNKRLKIIVIIDRNVSEKHGGH